MTGQTGAVMVVGGGISGVQASIDLAESGFKVYLIDNKPSIGGIMAQLDKTFPTNDCSLCILSPKLVEAARNPMIKMMTLTDVIGLEGEAPNFTVTVRRNPRYVLEDKCVGCGLCAEKCPVKVDNEYDVGLMKRKAIYVPYAQAVPIKYTIDPDKCIYLKKKQCGNCKKICPPGAIDFEQKATIENLQVGAIILAPGGVVFDAKLKKEYGYGEYKNVVTSLEFERILSATGPFQGHIERPSDLRTPKNVAFLQCVGSRDEKVGNNYCSSVCCMYALKQSIIAGEHTAGLKPSIFFMDIRAFGKEFEDYRARAESEYGIRMVRGSRVASVDEDPETKNLLLRYSVGADTITEEFDMVVLSVGFEPPTCANQFSEIMKFKLNKYGFAETNVYDPLATTRNGIYVTGVFSAPKDIPQSVAEASGAAARAGSHVYANRVPYLKTVVPEVSVEGQEPRVGVFVCDCGINILATVDVPKVVEYSKTLPNVAWAEEGKYACSADFQERIKQRITEQKLNRVVVASCTPRTHEPLFQSTMEEVGLNPYLFEMANIRDQCSWVHQHEPEKATQKSMDLVRMAVAKAKLIGPLSRAKFDVGHSATVIGGGLSGLTAAFEVATQGFKVDLIEKSDSLGGNAKRIFLEENGKTAKQAVEELIAKVTSNEKITVHLSTKIDSISGFVGNFKIKTPKGEIETGAIVVATGGEEYKPTEYLYGQDKRVMTQLELAQHLAEKPLDAKKVVMIQCIGSRNEQVPYCSRVCCTTAVKNAINIKKKSPETEVYILHKDIRTYGFREDYYTEAGKMGVQFIRFPENESPIMEKNDRTLSIQVKDVVLGETIELHPDAVILSTGIRPTEDNLDLAKSLKIPLSKDKFFLESHMKLRPVDFAKQGVFMAGLAHWPKFVEESIAQASGAASRAMTVISKDFMESIANISIVDQSKCRGCGRCEAVCEFAAASVQEISPGVFKTTINPALCKGCGACAVACCNGAITCLNFTNKQILAMVDTCLEEAVK